MTKLTKAWLFDDGTIQKAASTSQQLTGDPFSYGGDGAEAGLQRPLYDLDQLAQTLESNTLHARAVKQKSSDVAGRGFQLRARELAGDRQASAEQETTWNGFVEEVEDDDRGDESFKDRIVAAHQDFESIGWGILEVSRRGDGVPDGLWHVPAHTIRAHKDGKRFAQKRGGKTVWFKRFGVAGDVERTRGGWSTSSLSPDVRGNELIVVRNYSPRSDFYGLPDHIPALSALAGWQAQAEFNVRFFDRNAVPLYAVVIEGADISPDLEELIKEHFQQIKGKPHSTLVLPVPGGGGDEANAPKVRFEKLAVDIKDASFRLYKQDNALEICIAHGIPPYRIGWPILGSLGGATAEEMTQIYNDSIVQPRQETWEQRLNRALLGKKGLALTDWELKAKELDTRNVLRDLQLAQGLYALDVITPNDIARFFGYDEREDAGGDLYSSQRPSAAPFSLGPIESDVLAKRWGPEVTALTELRKQVEQLLATEAKAA